MTERGCSGYGGFHSTLIERWSIMSPDGASVALIASIKQVACSSPASEDWAGSCSLFACIHRHVAHLSHSHALDPVSLSPQHRSVEHSYAVHRSYVYFSCTSVSIFLCICQLRYSSSLYGMSFYARQLYRQVLLRARISYGNSVCLSVWHDPVRIQCQVR